MRFRVDTRCGYVSFDVEDAEKAWEVYKDGGFRIRLCEGLHDEGVVLDGLPLEIDVSPKKKWERV